MDIAVIGSNMVDLITYTNQMPKEGETLEAPAFKIGCGGKGANQAVAAAKLNSKVLMLTKVGDDIFADNTIRNLESWGINTTYVEKVPCTSSGVAPIFVNANSSNSILIIKGANKFLSPEDIDRAAEDLKKCQLIVLQLEVQLETVYHAIEFGKKHGIEVLLNPAPALRELDMSYACKCDFFVPNETELEILTGMPVDTYDHIRAAARSLVDKGLNNIIVTMGEKGALWMTRDQEVHFRHCDWPERGDFRHCDWPEFPGNGGEHLQFDDRAESLRHAAAEYQPDLLSDRRGGRHFIG
ncbi:Ribokinase [Salmonella enterica subsp. enterica serovar Uganda str. R8-3404]|uniref:Deoxyribokinase n=1 Tax=Salmonella enterica subsp. enterica serovar Uganda str. R8-3404 TaxID=913083 RepID=A0A6C8GV11_SALET|nr:Ribokinase [Salmonella enterica subsp. enterica serovar Uganda str. R8-3404]